MRLIVPSVVLSVFFIIVGAALSYTGAFGFYLDVLMCAIAMLFYGVCCLVCLNKAAKGKTKFYATCPIYLGFLLAIILGSLGLYSGTINVTELWVMLAVLITNAVLIRQLGFAKNT